MERYKDWSNWCWRNGRLSNNIETSKNSRSKNRGYPSSWFEVFKVEKSLSLPLYNINIYIKNLNKRNTYNNLRCEVHSFFFNLENLHINIRSHWLIQWYHICIFGTFSKINVNIKKRFYGKQNKHFMIPSRNIEIKGGCTSLFVDFV